MSQRVSPVPFGLSPPPRLRLKVESRESCPRCCDPVRGGAGPWSMVERWVRRAGMGTGPEPAGGVSGLAPTAQAGARKIGAAGFEAGSIRIAVFRLEALQ